MPDLFDKATKAASSAFDTVSSAAGVESDDDLIMYNTLEPDDFKQIVSKFGMDATSEYIDEMERRNARR